MTKNFKVLKLYRITNIYVYIVLLVMFKLLIDSLRKGLFAVSL